MHVASGLFRSEIGEPELVSLNDIAYGHRYLGAELWAAVTERVKFAPFATGIDTWGQVRQEPLVALPTDEPLA